MGDSLRWQAHQEVRQALAAAAAPDRTPARHQALSRPDSTAAIGRTTTRAAPADPGHGSVRRGRHAGTVRASSRQRCLRATWLQDWSALDETGDGIRSIPF
jgi:hypothetical protein